MLCGVPERRAAFLFRIVGGRLERAPPGQWVSRPPGVVARSRDRRRTRLPNDRRRTQEVLALCRQGATIQRGDPRRMASCRWAVGLSWTPMARLVWDGLVFAGNRPGALAPRPRRRVFGVERQASQSGGDNQAAASASPAPSQELDVRLTGTNPSADRKRGPESRLVTQGAPAHLKVRPPRAPRGQDVFLDWGAPVSFSPRRTGPLARAGQTDVRQEMSANGAEPSTETRPSHRSGWVPDLRPAGRPRRRHLR
jgi:hypothetical protein